MTDDLPLRCWAELDGSALRHNAAVARARGGSGILAVVKADAYGHGAVWAARTLEDTVEIFGVANLREAVELRTAGIEKPIYLLSPCLPEEWPHALRLGCQVGISSVEEALALDATARRFGVTAPAHLVVDTGMGRIGFLEETWEVTLSQSAATLRALEHVSWEGITTHLPSPDEDETFTRAQLARFRHLVDATAAHGLKPAWVHAANGAGLLGYAEQQGWCSLTRPGLLLYGASPLPADQPSLRPVLTWKTRVTQVRELPAGHGVSYGRTFITQRPTRVATLACGYADGYPRQASGRGAQVLIRGTRCPMLGRVTMDQFMADITPLDDRIQPGEEVVLIGTQGAEQILAAELAVWAGTIPWHIFTGLGRREARIVR